MSAQRELVELVEIPNPEEAPSWNACCGAFIRAHGPALAELIEAVGAYMDKPNLQMAGPMGAALAKLTEPKA